MKKIRVMLVALLVVGLAFTSCGLFNPVKDTTWEATEEVTVFGITYSYTYTLSFKDKDVTLDETYSWTVASITLSDSDSYYGTYEYKNGEVTGTMNIEGVTRSFTGIIEKNTMEIDFGLGTRTYTKVDD